MNKPTHIATFSNLSLFACLLISSAAAQRLPFKNYTTADGLPGSDIRDITQDKYGYIWINTDGGVAQFDGVAFRNHTAEADLSYLYCDSLGYVYLSGPAGLWRIAGAERKFYPYAKLHGPAAYALQEKDGILWFWHNADAGEADKYAGLSKLADDHLEEFPDSLLQPSAELRPHHFLPDYQGNFWFGFSRDNLREQHVWHKFANGKFEEIHAYGIPEEYSIYNVIVDRYGNLWFFASKRIGQHWTETTYKFAKSRLTEYSDSTGFRLREGILDNEGNFWLVASKYDRASKIHRPAGVVKAVEDTLQWFTTKNGLATDEVMWIFRGKSGSLWFVQGKAATRYRDGDFKNITGNFGWSNIEFSESSYVWNVFEDSKGRVWFAWTTWNKKKKKGSLGITRYADGEIKNYASQQGITGEFWMGKPSLFDWNLEKIFWEDKDSTVWFQTEKALYCVRNGELQTYDQNNGLAGPLKGVLFPDREGNVWIGTAAGVSKLADQCYELYTREEGLTSNFVYSPYQDQKGRMWVLADRQVCSLSEKKIEKFDLETNVIVGFCEDERGNIYFNLGNRVGKFDGEKIEHFDLPHMAPVVQRDAVGNIWFGECCGEGVSKFDGEKIHQYTAKDGLANRSVRTILQDWRSHLWFAGSAGISEFDGAKFINHATDLGILTSSDWDCSVDQRKHIWLRNRGVLRDLTDSNEPVRQVPEIVRGEKPVSFWDRQEGNCWLGTEQGLIKIGRNGHQIFTIKHGLPGNKISGMAEDSLGHIWVSTQNGVGVYDGIRFHDYNREHGLPPIQINGNPFVDKNGKIWFGSVAGLIKVNIARAFEETVPPLLYFKSIRIDTLQISSQENLKLKHSQNNLAFSYLGLSFKNEKAIRYQYCLDGYDKEWSQATDKLEVQYTNLDPGRYVFKVKAIGGAGVESEIASAAFTIVPPFWKTWWFLALSGLSLAFIGYAGYRYRLQAKLEKARILNELKAARDMQMGLMPKSDPVIPGFDISGICKPAEEVGGDYFDYFWLDKEKTKFGIAIVDVSGKAMKGAMTAVMASGMLYSEVSNSHSPRIILRKINKPMYLKTDRQIFTTMSFAVIDTQSKTLTFASAGQTQPMLKRNGETQYLKIEGMHFPLGIREEVEYEEVTTQLQPGDMVIFYTDGIPEAMNEKNEMFDLERMETAMRHLPPSSRAAEVIEKLFSEMRKFTGTAMPHDDMTVVVLRVA